MDALDLDVRRHVYRSVVDDGRPASVSEAAAALGRSAEDVAGAYQRLHEAHALVLHPGTTDVWMANPFSAVGTPHRVRAGTRRWFANCAWDALGIPAALHADGDVESECACCGERVALSVRDGALARGAELLVHILMPARRWWDDIGFT